MFLVNMFQSTMTFLGVTIWYYNKPFSPTVSCRTLSRCC